MRNAFGLMCATVVSAVVIAAVWYWTSSPRADAAVPPQTVNARKAEPLPVAAAKPAVPDDVEVTAGLAAPAPPQARAAPVQQKCANPDALGVGRVVEADTTGGPGFGFQQYKQLDFLTERKSC